MKTTPAHTRLRKKQGRRTQRDVLLHLIVFVFLLALLVTSFKVALSLPELLRWIRSGTPSLVYQPSPSPSPTPKLEPTRADKARDA